MSCVISLFYIKPQLPCSKGLLLSVALYLFSTSNHNSFRTGYMLLRVALYLFSTSNHNVQSLIIYKSFIYIGFYYYEVAFLMHFRQQIYQNNSNCIGRGCSFSSIAPQIFTIPEYCLSVKEMILTFPFSGTKPLIRLICIFALS